MKLPIGSLCVALLCASSQVAALVAGKPQQQIQPYKRQALQDIVTWDEHSIFVRGERVMFYSGEYHPFRLPVPSLWLDVFQKIKALGYNGVSFYVDWALLEGKPGSFSAEGIFALEPFFEAATKAGIYLLARPGPYINAEASGGGFPGWLQRVPGILRTADPTYLQATDNYARNINQIIAKGQITNGGPIILYQPENEYTGAVPGVEFPDPDYMEYIYKQARDAGIVVPFMSNDASVGGHNAPGQPAPVDIYGHDGYPLGFDCSNPTVWPNEKLPTTWHQLHLQISPNTPYSIPEFQGGSFDPWGGPGFEKCLALVNSEFERVFYKNLFSFGVTIVNFYMTFGGTNWGNLGHPGGYTSYDYGSVIAEDRSVSREKYSEAKLEANFIQASPAYWTATPGNATNGTYASSAALTVTPLTSNSTKFYVVRHAVYNSLDSTSYRLQLPTTAGTLSIPQGSGILTLNGRDSKIHVTDYDLGGTNLLYSTAEIFTWKKYDTKTVLVVYGGPNEQHELAVAGSGKASTVEGNAVSQTINNTTVINWTVSPARSVVVVNDNLFIYLLVRNEAYNYWVLHAGESDVVAKAGYLVRTAKVDGSTLTLTGDLNATAPLEIIGGAPDGLSKVTWNGGDLTFKQDDNGVVTADISYSKADVTLPSLEDAAWYYIDTLPEIQTSYSDAAWTTADHKTTNNTAPNNVPTPITTPTVLYSSDYGYHTGTLIYRGHFTANGQESTLMLQTQGGYAFGSSAWINNTYIGSFPGAGAYSNYNSTYDIPELQSGQSYIITVVVDNMGLEENWVVGQEGMKLPRGVLRYDLAGHSASDVTWKLTGNLGGEDFVDKVRGPLNEGGLWAERQGFHQPVPPVEQWEKVTGGPLAGINGTGIGFYVTSFDLDMPKGYDIPLSFVFSNNTNAAGQAAQYRAQLYVNGYQFGKYVNHVGPQTKFAVPEGILDYHGTNWVAVSLWSHEEEGAKLGGLELSADAVIQTGYGEVELSPLPKWEQRDGAY